MWIIADEIYHNIINIIKAIQARSKNTTIYLLSIVPVNEMGHMQDASKFARDRANFDIKMLNYYLRNYARKNQLGYVNVAKHLMNDYDQLNTEYTTDGFHLNDYGNKVYLQTIKRYV